MQSHGMRRPQVHLVDPPGYGPDAVAIISTSHCASVILSIMAGRVIPAPVHHAETGAGPLDKSLDEIRVRDIACAREDAIFGKGVPSRFKPVRVHVG